MQIGRFWWNALHGDLGVSHIYKVNASVTGILAKKLPISIQMGVFAMLLSLVIGIPMGLLMGRFKNRWPDKIGTAIIVLIQAVPAPCITFIFRCTAPPPWAWACCLMPPTGGTGCCRSAP